MSRRHPREPQPLPPPCVSTSRRPPVCPAAAKPDSGRARPAARWPFTTLLLAGAAVSAPLAAQEGLQWRSPAAAPAVVAETGPQDTLRLGHGGLRPDLGRDGKGAPRAHLLGDLFLTGPGFGRAMSPAGCA
jgi:hypothetical protein